jgi:precorrin-2 dehydrogenase / sirohydrochlorin ferrochelatase
MIAVALDVAVLPVGLAGRGPGAVRRLAALHAAGSRHLQVFSDRPDQDLDAAAGPALRDHLPDRAELAALRALWIVGLQDDQASELAALARSERVLVNVEDRPALCDFHNVAEVRRGDLLLTVSTGGASPGLAARIRARLGAEFGPEWADRLRLLRERRAGWRRDGQDVGTLTDALLHANGWLA